MKEVGTKTLLKLYVRLRNTRYPNSARARFVIPNQYVKNPHTTINIDQLRSRQQMFIKCVVSSEIWCISNLDFKSGPESKTLRDILLKLRVSNLPDQHLFITNDTHWTGDDHSFRYLPQFEQDARLMIGNLIPYLSHHEEEWIRTLFSSKCLEANVGNT